MKPTQMLHDLGQSLWLDNITRDLLDSGTLKRYIDELSVTGLTSNPTIFDHAIKNSTAYDAAIREKLQAGQIGRGAVLRAGARGPHAGRRPVSADPRPDRRRGRLGVAGSVAAAGLRHREHAGRGQGPACARAARPNLFIKIPGTKEGLAGHRGGDLRRRAGQRDAAVLARAVPGGGRGVPARHRAAHRRRAQSRRRLGRLAVRQPLGRRGGGQGAGRAANQLGIAIAKRTYKAYRELLDSPRWQRVYNAGARPQRLLWASTGTKDPKASDVLYIKALAAPFTVNTMPEGTLKAFADHGEVGAILPADGGDCEDSAGAVRQGRHRRRRPGRPAPGRRRQGVRRSPGTT